MKQIADYIFSRFSKPRPEEGEDDMATDELALFQDLFAKDIARRQKQVDRRARRLRRRGLLRRRRADLFH